MYTLKINEQILCLYKKHFEHLFSKTPTNYQVYITKNGLVRRRPASRFATK